MRSFTAWFFVGGLAVKSTARGKGLLEELESNGPAVKSWTVKLRVNHE